MARTASDEMTGTQKERFKNITNRIAPKILATFGKTIESEYVGEVQRAPDYYNDVLRTIEVQSRGVIYSFTIEARRADAS